MTSDSISTRPRMNTPRISPAALGLRAIASAEAARPLAWPSVPNAAAKPRANPAVMIDHLISSGFVGRGPGLLGVQRHDRHERQHEQHVENGTIPHDHSLLEVNNDPMTKR